MNQLYNYVQEHTLRGACTCGKCFDAGENPDENQPTGHTVNLTFFKVAAPTADKDTLKRIVEENYPALLDGQEHNYLEIGGELGDQGMALMLIGLGGVVGLWQALSPDTLMPMMDEATKQRMAGLGMVTMRYPIEKEAAEEAAVENQTNK